MNVNLGDVFDRFVTDLLKSGLYQSQSEVVREGLRLLKEREDLRELRLAELRREIAIGSAEARQEMRRGYVLTQTRFQTRFGDRPRNSQTARFLILNFESAGAVALRRVSTTLPLTA